MDLCVHAPLRQIVNFVAQFFDARLIFVFSFLAFVRDILQFLFFLLLKFAGSGDFGLNLKTVACRL
ncbi:MAG: hypothetical protein RBU23_12695 [Candidatus Auribacterota bacterium]|nr:hypothetical protein [Candidatus Auribacterota bacterium]